MGTENKYVPLTLRNPSPYWRDGFVVRSWAKVAAELGGDPTAARVYRVIDPGDPDSAVRPLAAQVDVLDPEDPARAQLVFSLGGPISAGDDQYTTASAYARVEAATENAPAGTATVEKFYTGAKLRNEFFELWLNTAKKHDEGVEGDYFAGAVTHVNLLKHQVNDIAIDGLDVIASELSWDRHPEQRAMQVDRVYLVRPPWDERGSYEGTLFTDHWRVVSVTQGPVRATATIASTPFEFGYEDAVGTERKFSCEVYRAISLYSGEEFIGDEIWVKATDLQSKQSHRFWFRAGFFMMVQFTADQEVFRYPDHPGWFTIRSLTRPGQGYAFATDANATALWNPPLDYPNRPVRHRAYAWSLGATRAAHCFHVFRYATDQKELTDLAGTLWYRLAFKRIRATLENEK